MSLAAEVAELATRIGTEIKAVRTTLAGYVPTTRTVGAGTGLSGGGDLSANRTLAVAYGTTAGTAAQGNDARLSDNRTPTDGTVTNAKVSASAAIAESKLALASDAAAGTASRRTLGTGATQAAAGNDSRITCAIPNTRTITAGAGLTGGGDLSADRTLALGTVSSARKYMASPALIDLTSAAAATVTLGSTAYSRGTAVSTATANALVGVVAGMYQINGWVYFPTGRGAGPRTVFVMVNGTSVGQLGYPVGSGANDCRPMISFDYLLAANDAVTLGVYAEGSPNPRIQAINSNDIGLTLTYIGP